MPEIWYVDNNEKKHRYHPDIFIPSKNLIIEVKSEYTLKADLEKNKKKMIAAEQTGFDFEFRIYNEKSKWVRIINELNDEFFNSDQNEL